MECEHSKCEPAVCTYYGSQLAQLVTNWWHLTQLSRVFYYVKFHAQLVTNWWLVHNWWRSPVRPAGFALTMECEPAMCTYYGSHLLWSANTVGELTMAHTYYTYQWWGSYRSHKKCIWHTESAQCVSHHLPQVDWHTYQVRGSHQTYNWLILSVRESLNRLWSHVYRKCTGNLIWTISSAHACCREAPYHMHISNASCTPEGLPSFYPWCETREQALQYNLCILILRIYLSTDYFGTRQIIFGNNMNTIEILLKWGILGRMGSKMMPFC